MSKQLKKGTHHQDERYQLRDQDGRFGRVDRGFDQASKGVETRSHGAVNLVQTGGAKEPAVTWELHATSQIEYVDPYLYESGFFESPEERDKLVAFTPIVSCSSRKAE